jgi:two-component system cell cycle response regulator
MPQGPSGTEPRVLIVDSCAETRAWVGEQFAGPFQVLEAVDGKTASEIIRLGNADVAVVGPCLADGVGIDWIQCKNMKNIPAILIGGENQLVPFMKGGSFRDFVRSPPSGQELVARVNMALEYSYLASQAAQFINALKQQSESDALTGIGNRFVLKAAGPKEIAKARRAHQELSLLMLDIDDFKMVNDAYGHLVGDDVLVQIANLLMENLRTYDIVVRYGGDEFVVVLPHTDREQSAAVTEKILSAVRRFRVHVGASTVSATVSIGCATYLPTENDDVSDLKEFQTLLDAADRALYQAKNQGKDRLCSTIIT